MRKVTLFLYYLRTYICVYTTECLIFYEYFSKVKPFQIVSFFKIYESAQRKQILT
jgi:hypothetical protein